MRAGFPLLFSVLSSEEDESCISYMYNHLFAPHREVSNVIVICLFKKSTAHSRDH